MKTDPLTDYKPCISVYFLYRKYKRGFVINKQMLERMWRKGDPSTLLVGMQTGEATVENIMEFPQKTKNGTAL